MRESTIKIFENIYDSEVKEGSICENCIIINVSEHSLEKITNDGILSARFRRSFYDNNLNLVTVEIVAPQINEVEKLIKNLRKVEDEKYKIVKNRNFSLNEHLKKLTIKFSFGETSYEIGKEEVLGKEILDMSGLNIMINKSNKEILDLKKKKKRGKN